MGCFYRGCNDEQVRALALMGDKEKHKRINRQQSQCDLCLPLHETWGLQMGAFFTVHEHTNQTHHTRFALSRGAGGQICPAEMSHPISICHTHPPPNPRSPLSHPSFSLPHLPPPSKPSTFTVDPHWPTHLLVS